MTFVAACAAGLRSQETGGGGEGGEGGDFTTSTTSGGPKDAGKDAVAWDGAAIACSVASDCNIVADACNAGACVNGFCERAPSNAFGACDDGLFCTDNDTCVDGACVGGTAKFCPSLDSCHIGVCDEEKTTCKNIAGNEGAQCDDGDACTNVGTCSAGVCGKGPQIDCSAFNGTCTQGVCDPMLGCVAKPINNGTPCNDSLYCTINDSCQNGICTGEANTCTAPGDVCMIGACDEGTDKCVAVPGNDGAACDDMNLCTTGETCASGICLGGQAANEGAACDDANACTGGTSCVAGDCTNPMSQVVQCINGDQCCPAGCGGNDSDCLYWASGVLENVSPATLTGWSVCWSGTYDQNQPAMSTILQQCDKGKLLLACRPVGGATYTLAAMGPRADVLFDCGMQSGCVHDMNGVGWYYSDSWSWGFVPAGETVSRNSCDVANTQPNLRMCWHSGGGSINSGYRCGNNFLNGDANWERVVLEAD
jgi:hypothetical protein